MTANSTNPSACASRPNCAPPGSTPLAPMPPPSDPLAELYDELLSARGPFWLAAEDRQSDAPRPRAVQARRALSRELDVLKKKPPPDIPRAVVVQDGGPKGTRHEGFKDAQVFLRGNPKRLGKTVPRGVPRVLGSATVTQLRITTGKRPARTGGLAGAAATIR